MINGQIESENSLNLALLRIFAQTPSVIRADI